MVRTTSWQSSRHVCLRGSGPEVWVLMTFEFWRRGRFRKQKFLLLANCFKYFDFRISFNIYWDETHFSVVNNDCIYSFGGKSDEFPYKKLKTKIACIFWRHSFLGRPLQLQNKNKKYQKVDIRSRKNPSPLRTVRVTKSSASVSIVTRASTTV